MRKQLKKKPAPKTTKKAAPPKAEKKAKAGSTRQESLQLLANQLTSAMKGNGQIVLGASVLSSKRFPIGLLPFDIITGGGLLAGRFHEFYGAESAFKTSLAMLCVAAVQRNGGKNGTPGTACWVAREEFDKGWAKALGVDVDRLVLIETSHGDVSLETALTLLESGLVDILVLDSIQAFSTTREANDSVEQESYGGGGAGQMWGRVMRRCYAALNAGKCAHTYMIGISQVRMPIGKFSGHAPPEPQPSQIRAILHWKSISIYCKRGQSYYAHDSNKLKRIVYARDFILHCKKNKTAVSDRQGEFRYFFRSVQTEEEGRIDKGVDQVEACFRFGRALGVIQMKGSFYEAFGCRKQGAAAFRLAVRKDPKLLQAIYDAVIDTALDDRGELQVKLEEMGARDKK